MDSKDPEEIVTVTFPFGAELNGATINPAPAVAIAVVKGADPDVAQMLNGAPEIDAQNGDVLQSVKDGIDANDYHMRCVATLSDGRRLVRALPLPLRRR